MMDRPFWTPARMQQITGGRFLQPPSGDITLRGLGTDTRTLAEGEVFLAIPGERFDGHDFVPAAVQAGAAMAIVSREIPLPPVGHAAVLLVPDTLTALGQLAAAWRDELVAAGLRIVAVTGSCGKTTTRVLIHALLSRAAPTCQAPASYNNHIGVPLTLLSARPEHQYLVAEVGTNHPGEIADLSALVRPHVGVVTHIGRAHLEAFGSVEAIRREKLSMLEHLQPPPEGPPLAVVPEEEAAAAEAKHLPCGTKVATVAAIGRDGASPVMREAGGGMRFAWRGEWFSLALPGKHNVRNALIALKIAAWAGVDEHAMRKALAAAKPALMRSVIERIGTDEQTIVLINDAYNANPDSMAAGLEVLASEHPPGRGGRRIAILGDMLELGEATDAAHRELGKLVATIPSDTGMQPAVDMAAFVGHHAAAAAMEANQWRPEMLAEHYDSLDGPVVDELLGRVMPGDVVLLKASRGIGLERLIEPLRRRVMART